jgi:hypothetical protein
LAQADERFARAEPLINALAPIIDICLQLGLTHFELESLLRVAFVQRAADALPKDKFGRGPSHEAIGLAAGLNRGEVQDILAKGPKGAAKRMEGKSKQYSKSEKVLMLWRTDERYKSVNGVPLKLPLELTPDGPSFAELVQKALPGRHPANVLKDLKRRGHVQMLSDEIVGYKRGGGAPATKFSTDIVSSLSLKLRAHGDALLHAVLDEKQKAAGAPSIYLSSEPVKVPVDQLKNSESALAERILNFFQRIETEFGKASKAVETESIILTIHSSKA